MSRSGYTEAEGFDDYWDYIRWRGAVRAAIRGKRGQKLLRELRDALDAMEDKRLIKGEFVTPEGDCCALGALALHRGWKDAAEIDFEEHEWLANRCNVAPALVREIEWENDENGGADPEQRWKIIRDWVEENIIEVSQ